MRWLVGFVVLATSCRTSPENAVLEAYLEPRPRTDLACRADDPAMQRGFTARVYQRENKDGLTTFLVGFWVADKMADGIVTDLTVDVTDADRPEIRDAILIDAFTGKSLSAAHRIQDGRIVFPQIRVLAHPQIIRFEAYAKPRVVKQSVF